LDLQQQPPKPPVFRVKVNEPQKPDHISNQHKCPSMPLTNYPVQYIPPNINETIDFSRPPREGDRAAYVHPVYQKRGTIRLLQNDGWVEMECDDGKWLCSYIKDFKLLNVVKNKCPSRPIGLYNVPYIPSRNNEIIDNSRLPGLGERAIYNNTRGTIRLLDNNFAEMHCDDGSLNAQWVCDEILKFKLLTSDKNINNNIFYKL
jgi:hypothetical protein